MSSPIGKNPNNASAIIPYYKKKILLQKRSNNPKIYYPGFWGCFGGALNKNEKYEMAIIREFKEETNIKLKKSNFKYLMNVDFTIPIKNIIIRRRFYVYKIISIQKFKKEFLLGEGDDYSFFNINSFNNLNKVVPYDKLAIDNFFHILK